ncbi:MAG TPA: LysE family translocator [Actinophytocola sp.]|uniref:LysE family translocator n=1 Tax=Actinophytocola sp. TaxID=1872138 RepID=UPI002DDCB04A|nr:LysE family translocator [Actinophytocola sp.]HEV2779121.1 LysE family translocator [Actinophytocola sp.]
MPTSAEWLVFLGAATLFAIIPGPGILYVLARSLRGGRSDGIRSTLGNGIGALAHVAAAAVGLSAVLAASATAFTVVKLLGAGYLIYLGLRALLDRDHLPVAEPVGRRPRPGGSPVVQGMVSELLNPKTALFFLAFLPHFVHPDAAPAPLVFALLGAIAVAMTVVVDLTVAVFAGALGQRLMGSPRWRTRQRVASGLTMIGLGGALALAERG